MEPSIQYSTLKVRQEIHAECRQRTLGLGTISRSGDHSEELNSKLVLVADRVEQLFREIEEDAIQGTPIVVALTYRGLEQAERRKWGWVGEALETLMFAHQKKTLTAEMCDTVLMAIQEAKNAATV